MIDPVKSACNKFPQILGSSDSTTSLLQIDAFGDYLALAGYTYDNLLKGGTTGYGSFPYLALTSISTGNY